MTTLDKTGLTDDEYVVSINTLPAPELLLAEFPIHGTDIESLVAKTRQNIKNILTNKDHRLLVVIGPCSIHDPQAAIEYAQKLQEQRDIYADSLEIVF